MKTMQIVSFQKDHKDEIIYGIKNFPIDKMTLVCYETDKNEAKKFIDEIKSILKISFEIICVNKQNVVMETIEKLSIIISTSKKQFNNILMNISTGDKYLISSCLTSAFINGVKTFEINDKSNLSITTPLIKLTYNEVISEEKIHILKSISKNIECHSLTELQRVSGYGKPLLSYHLNGSRNSKGLISMGLVEIEKSKRNKCIRPTLIGKLLSIDNVLI
ncbi:MAG: hypothetical protein ACPKPY_01250 [Nitrososphaeraceae archaeon]